MWDWLRMLFSSDYSKHKHSCLVCSFVGSADAFTTHTRETGHKLVWMEK